MGAGELLTDFSGLKKVLPMEKTMVPVPVSSINLPLDSTELTTEQAVKLTETIRNASEVLWILISRAHAGKAWLALAYPSWESYVYAEFDMSRSRSYQLLDQARVIREIEAAVPTGTQIHMSEAAARDLRGILDEVIPQIKERTEGLVPEEASIVVDQIVDEKRTGLLEGKQEAIIREREEAYSRVDEESDSEAFDSSLSARESRDRFENPPVPGNPLASMAPVPAPRANDVDVVKIRKNVNAAHDIYSSLSALSSLPEELEEVVAIIAPERYAQIDTHLEKAMENLLHFHKLWKSRGESEETQDEVDNLEF